MFSKTILTYVSSLRSFYSGRRNCVVAEYPTIEIIIYQKSREISLKLFYSEETNTFNIQPLDSKYYSKISFFDYKAPERRWSRNKQLLFYLVKDLQRCGLWNLVSNKDFLTINTQNERVAVEKRMELLKNMLNQE